LLPLSQSASPLHADQRAPVIPRRHLADRFDRHRPQDEPHRDRDEDWDQYDMGHDEDPVEQSPFVGTHIHPHD